MSCSSSRNIRSVSTQPVSDLDDDKSIPRRSSNTSSLTYYGSSGENCQHVGFGPAHDIPADHRPAFAPEKILRVETVTFAADTDSDLESTDDLLAGYNGQHRSRFRIRASTFLWRYVRSVFSRIAPERLIRGAKRRVRCFHGDASYRDCCRISSRSVRFVLLITFTSLAIMGLIQFLSLALGAYVAFFPDDFDFVVDHWGEVDQPSHGLAHWPTDFSADIQPVQCHSHNDYWRRAPLYEAISFGCVGVEADVWLFDEELYVGHTTSSLTPNRTLTSLYINPILDILERQNPLSHFHPESKGYNGVFDTNPDQSLILLVDIKTSGPATWPYVQKQLEPLREKGYLTHWNGSAVVERPVTIVGSGNTPYDLVTANTTYRDIFFDAPLESLAKTLPETQTEANGGSILNSGDPGEDELPLAPPTATDALPSPPSKSSALEAMISALPFISTSVRDQGQGHSLANESAELPPYSPANSYYASVSFKSSIGKIWQSRLTSQQLEKIRAQIKGAHDAGLKVRYWGIPSWPRGLRNHIWHVLIEEGADILNVDDLKGATMTDWRKRNGWWF